MDVRVFPFSNVNNVMNHLVQVAKVTHANTQYTNILNMANDVCLTNVLVVVTMSCPVPLFEFRYNSTQYRQTIFMKVKTRERERESATSNLVLS